jgi:hypothetical protein
MQKGWVRALSRKRVVATMAAIGLVSVGTGLAVNMPSAEGATTAIQITPIIPSHSVTKPIEAFFTTTITVNYIKGKLKMSGSAAGTGTMLVDDALVLHVTRPDGTTVAFSHDFDKVPCTPATPSKPIDISPMFQPGANKLTVALQDMCGGSEGSSAIWLK